MTTGFIKKTIFVTGASSGIGRAVCKELAFHGAYVILQGRNSKAIQETMENMSPEKCLPLVADLSDFHNLPTVVEQAEDWQGSIDGLVYCAGIGGRARLRDTSPEFMLERMQINCFAFVELVRQLIKRKKKKIPLRIVVISSFASLGHDKYYTAYAASKAALEAAAKTLASELRIHNTAVNIIRPAFVNTPMVIGAADPLGDFASRLEESGHQPLGLIPPEEVAQMAIYLLSSSAAHITGTVFSINGGTPC